MKINNKKLNRNNFVVEGDKNFITGNENKLEGNLNECFGNNNNLSGFKNKIKGNNNTIIGIKNKIKGHNNKIYKGYKNKLFGNNNRIYCNNSYIEGNNNNVIGNNNTIKGASNVITGKGNIINHVNFNVMLTNYISCNRIYECSFELFLKNSGGDDNNSIKCEETEVEEESCIICKANKKQILFLDCKHLICCFDCSKRLFINALEKEFNCIICKQLVVDVLQIYS